MVNTTQEKLSLCSSTTVADILMVMGLRNVSIHGLTALSVDQPRIVGPAYTLRFIPSREDVDTMANYANDGNLHRRAIEECPPSAILVIDAMGCTRAASIGDIMAERLKARGVAGVITDGGFRDAPGVAESGIPAFQKQSSPPATILALHPAELNGPIGCAGVPVYPGDIILGDQEGVVVIPAHLADEVADKALYRSEFELFVKEEIRKGRSIFGLFPTIAESSREFEEWRKENDPLNIRN